MPAYSALRRWLCCMYVAARASCYRRLGSPVWHLWRARWPSGLPPTSPTACVRGQPTTGRRGAGRTSTMIRQLPLCILYDYIMKDDNIIMIMSLYCACYSLKLVARIGLKWHHLRESSISRLHLQPCNVGERGFHFFLSLTSVPLYSCT